MSGSAEYCYSTVYQDCISQELPNLQKLGAISCRLPHTTDSFSLDCE